MTPPLPLRVLDSGIEAVLAAIRTIPPVEPLARTLSSHRLALVGDLVARYGPSVEAQREGVLAHDPAAIRDFDALAARALQDLRESRPEGPLALPALLDRLLYRDGHEYLDDPDFPERERLEVLAMVDRLNTRLGSYERWSALLEPLLSAAEAKGHRPVRVIDLAAGHGGFALALKASLGERVELTATDLKAEYLEVGRREALARGLDVRFSTQDATDLASLRGAEVDVFLCTQSLHHFPPGMVSRMFGEAARTARAGACFIDGERGLAQLALIAPLMLAWSRSWPTFHDTWVSLRRMPYQEELYLLARLAPALPPHAVITSGRQGPGFAWVRVSTA